MNEIEVEIKLKHGLYSYWIWQLDEVRRSIFHSLFPDGVEALNYEQVSRLAEICEEFKSV